AAAAPPAVRDALRFGQPREALGRPLRHRGLAAPLAPHRPAGTIPVTNCDDSGAGSLRDAVTNAVSGDVIDLSALTCSAITLDTGLVSTVDELTLTGPGAAALAIDGNNASRVIEHQGQYGMLTIEGLTIRNGSYVYSGAGVYGGLAPGACILSQSSVTLNAVAIDHCSASGWSVFGAAVDTLGALYMTDSAITGTTAIADATEISATIYGGAVYTKAGYLTRSTIDGATVTATSVRAFSGLLGGGIFGFYGVVLDQSRVSNVVAHVSAAKISYAKGAGVGTPNTVIMTGSTISGNEVHGTPGIGPSGAHTYTSAIGGGGVYVMAIPRGSVPASSITGSTISGNAAIVDGEPGAYTVGGGGALGTWAAKVFPITNSTISGNAADIRGGGIYTRDRGALALVNATVTDNTAPEGAGIADAADGSAYPFTVTSTIVAGNHAPTGTTADDIFTVHAIDGSNDLIGTANVAVPADTIGGDPRLGPLADNGGATLTHALLPDSPAIDAGSNPNALDTDQRGGSYVRTSGASPDIGAFEWQAAPDGIFADGFE
ncbi:MAG TPA: choice-of-anchor Q domain-containing protein, partial [Rhodanobacteraceae bacterium]